MIAVTATKLRNNLFELLAQVSKGETIAVRRNGEEVALLVPPKKDDWRERMKSAPKLLVPPEEAFASLEHEAEWEALL